MMMIDNYIQEFSQQFPALGNMLPWDITHTLAEKIITMLPMLNNNYEVRDNIAIHRLAVIEQNVIIKAPAIIRAGVFIGANAYLRGGVFLGENVSIGPGCEIKSSIIMKGTALAHFNFIGDSIIGSGVNFEAGAVVANHFNEKADKKILARIDNELLETGVEKFGALVGDRSCIGANAVLSPGTVLSCDTIVGRVELVSQQ